MNDNGYPRYGMKRKVRWAFFVQKREISAHFEQNASLWYKSEKVLKKTSPYNSARQTPKRGSSPKLSVFPFTKRQFKMGCRDGIWRESNTAFLYSCNCPLHESAWTLMIVDSDLNINGNLAKQVTWYISLLNILLILLKLFHPGQIVFMWLS